MKYVLNIAEDGRILSAGIYHITPPTGAVMVDELPEGRVTDYRYEGGFIYDPLPVPVVEEIPTTEERVTALEETAEQQGAILNILLNGETGDDA